MVIGYASTHNTVFQRIASPAPWCRFRNPDEKESDEMRTPVCLALALALLWSGSASAYDRYSGPRLPSRPDARYCADYARDYVRYHGQRGGGVDGAIGGAMRGAILGGLVDGKDGARRGARVGGAVGGLRGARDQRRDNSWLYHRAYDECMYHHGRY